MNIYSPVQYGVSPSYVWPQLGPCLTLGAPKGKVHAGLNRMLDDHMLVQ